jgi:hypothetical protein
LGDPPGGIPDRIPGGVLVAAEIIARAVVLDAESVDEEQVGPPPVVECVDLDAHEVV